MHPTLFTLFGESVSAYAVGSTLGYIAGVTFGIYLGLKDGRDLLDLIELGVVVVLSAVLGSKLFHVLFEAEGHMLSNGGKAQGIFDLLKDDPWHWARLFEGGYVFYGGVLVAIVLGWLFMVRRGLPDPGSVADYALPGLLFGIFIGRLGCFFAGCCYGAESSVAWAVSFPAGHPSDGAPVHPVQLYDASFGLIGFVLYVFFAKHRRFGGETFCAFMVSYAAFRFCTEMFRADADRGIWLGGSLSTSQIVALLAIPLTVLIWRRALRLARAGKIRNPREPLPRSSPMMSAT